MASKSKSKSAGMQAKNKKQVKADAKVKTARASKGTKKVQTAPQPEEDTRKLPGQKFIKQLSNDLMKVESRASAEAGAAGNLVSQASKNKGLNAPVFRHGHKLRKLGMRDPLKLRVWLDDWSYIAEALELEKLAGEQLFEPRAGAQEDDGDESDTSEDEPEAPTLAADAEEGEPAFH